MNNFFFNNRDCGKYRPALYVNQPNYSQQEVTDFLNIINKRFVMSPLFLLIGFCFCLTAGFGSMILPEWLFVGLGGGFFIMTTSCICSCYLKSKFVEWMAA